MPVVFVTGGARRIGKGLAHSFAQKGWDVGIVYHSSKQAAEDTVFDLQSFGIRAAAVGADVSVPQQLMDALDSLRNTLGNPDAIVSNAGVFPPQRTVSELTLHDVQKTLDVNTLPLLTIAKWYSICPSGRLIAISSLGAFETWKDRVDYNLSKAALVNLVCSLARSLAPSHTVNSVAPGAIVINSEPSDADKELAKLERIPMQRYGTPDDVFDAVWFFATATPYITGQIITVDGGYRLVR